MSSSSSSSSTPAIAPAPAAPPARIDPSAFKSDIGFVNPPKTALTPEETKRLETELATLKGAETKVYIDEDGVVADVGENEIKAASTLYFKRCKNCTYTVTSHLTKLMIEGCENFTLNVHGKVITQVIEAWNLTGVTKLNILSPIKTIQLDLSENVEIVYEKRDHFQQIIWGSTKLMRLIIKDAGVDHKSGLDVVKVFNKTVNDQMDQFIIRLLKNKITGREELNDEVIVRLDGGYPTTEREAKDFDRRQEENMRIMAQEFLGKDLKLNKKKAAEGPKIGRNDPCFCGSKKKYKACCATNKY
eukprot:TRINITY_DN3949_c0_g2_i1.p1 TRINITY_DN3949_c0_g2~~TRINITY_DN3949_c0_g2_i1.p1  ORF type:complete len:302 (+),score=85.98 TRINITY_DN3949_c0_g2_i1:76-981(+)